MKKYSVLVLLLASFVFITSCGSDDDENGPKKSEARQITSFAFESELNDALEEDIEGIIDEQNKTVTATVPYGTQITSLLPTIEVSEKASVNNEEARNFTNPVEYTVTAEDGSVATYAVTVNLTASDEKQITEFIFLANDNDALNKDVVATIDEAAKTITATVDFGTDVTSLSPAIKATVGATVNPTGVQDFTDPVSYTVTAKDNSTVTYEVSITEAAPDNDKRIISFKFLASDNAGFDKDITGSIHEEDKNIFVSVPGGTDVTSLTPSIEISEMASIDPAGAQDFTNRVVYTVTAQDNSTASYTVSVNVVVSERDALIALYNSNPHNTLGWDIQNADISTWAGVTVADGHVTELDLLKMGLDVLPSEIGILTKLERLQLRGNNIRTIPSEIGLVEELTYLNLESNKVTGIPSEIGALTKLKTIQLHHNNIKSLPAEIGLLDQLGQLVISSNNLTSLPAEIGQLGNLWDLNLAYNNIASLPAEIGQLRSLKMLHIQNNQLSTLPAEIANLYSLTNLYADRNNFTALPNGIFGLSAIKAVTFEYNSITTISSQVNNISTLTYLKLDGNSLAQVPKEIGQLSNLKTLSVRYNSLSSIPTEIGNLTNLERLWLTNNNLTSVPQAVCDLKTNYGTDLLVDDGVACQ